MSVHRYELIDFGSGRKLESLGGYLIDRPSPPAQGARKQMPGLWTDAAAIFDVHERQWRHDATWPADLNVDCVGFRMPVRPTPFGHIGLFPEQAPNWRWLAGDRVGPAETRQALNLFAYTGAGTMALVSAGYQVAHVDAAKPNVQAAREAAELNGWSGSPIRYLVEDASRFVTKEIRRGRRYHTIVMDPPAYGHTPKGKAWRLERDLWPLIESCLQLVDPDDFRLLITGHSPQIDATDVRRFVEQSRFIDLPRRQSGLRMQSGRSQLKDASGRSLDTGFYVRVSVSTPPLRSP